MHLDLALQMSKSLLNAQRWGDAHAAKLYLSMNVLDLQITLK